MMIRKTGLAALLVAALLTGASAQERRTLSGHVPVSTSPAKGIGRLPADRSLRLAIGLPLRDEAGLNRFLQDIYDPSSPNYRQYLTPEEFTARFGPAEADYQAAIEFALAHSLAVTGMHANRMLLDVIGSVADVENAFQITLRTYQHPSEDRIYFAPDSEPSVEANLPVQDISGLSDFRLPRPNHLKPVPLRRSANATPRAAGSFGFGQFIGNDFRAAYLPGVALTGAGQSIGLVEFDGYHAGDITSYEGLAGLTAVPIQKVLLDSFDGTVQSATGNEEVALDIEMVMSTAPGLSNIVVYEAGTNGVPDDILSDMSDNAGIKQFSCSWSFGSYPKPTMDTYFKKMAAQGQSFFAASGDGGAYIGSWPAPNDDTNITLVGGTALSTCAASGAWLSETAWNAGDGLNYSSGGYSTDYSIPAWQKGINMTTNGGSTKYRNIPDVAMVADNILEVADDGQQEITGGTSAAVQLCAAFNALVNQQAARSGLGPVGFINPAIYALAKSAKYPAVFANVATGNTTNENGVANKFFAVSGYNLCTGWGSPIGGSLILALATNDRLIITPGRGFAANGPVGGPFTMTSLKLSLTNAGTASLNWSVNNTSDWLTVSTPGGALNPGGPATNVSVSFAPSAYSLPAGVYTANVQFTNSTTGLGQTRQFTLQVGQELIQDGGFECGDFAYWNLFGKYATDYNFVDDGTYGPAPEAGNYYANLEASNVVDYLAQDLFTRAGQYYLISFWWTSLDIGSGTTPNQFLVKWNATTLTNGVNVGSFDWIQRQFIIQTSTTNSVLEFGFRDDPAIMGLDAVSVTAIPTPSFLSTSPSNNVVQLTWNALAGVSYQVQSTTNLISPSWSNLGGRVTAAAATATISDTIDPDDWGKFYRVALAP